MTTFYPYRSRRRYTQSDGINADYTWWVKCEALGKERSRESPYLFANEWITGNIAQFLRLPIPPFALMAKRTKKTGMFCSYSFRGDTTPRDVKGDILYAKYPDICTGIVLFDALVLNCDRHGGNLKVDDPLNPRDYYIFDHERALLYVIANDGPQRLESRKDRLGITDGSDSSWEWHCLVEHVDSVPIIQKWLSRIRDIPNWFIDDLCDEVCGLGIKKPECEKVAAFLKDRKNKLPELISLHRDRFPKIQTSDWPMFL